jgi:hypothetical protein
MVLDYWEAGSWRLESIPRMLERYRETDPAAPGEERYVDRSESGETNIMARCKRRGVVSN